jgi:hypothetical protein
MTPTIDHMNDEDDRGLDDEVHRCAPASRVDAASGRYVYRAAFISYDVVTDRDRDDYGETVPPAEPGTLHAVRQWSHSGRRPSHPTRSFDRLHDTDAMCGRHGKLMSPQRFDPSDEDACPACVERIRLDHYRPDGGGQR